MCGTTCLMTRPWERLTKKELIKHLEAYSQAYVQYLHELNKYQTEVDKLRRQVKRLRKKARK